MKGSNLFRVFKYILYFLASLFQIIPKPIKNFLWDISSVFGGKLAVAFRYVLLKSTAKKIGDNVYVGKYVVLKNLQNVEIGNNVSIHDYSYLDGLGGLKIGDNVSIAHNCSILTTNHQWNNLELPIKYNSEILKEVLIDSDVWLGCGVRVLSGVTISNRSVLAAGAVVTKNVEANSIYGGIPAVKIKSLV